VYDYVAGKVDWLANNLGTEGTLAHQPTAGSLARDDLATVSLEDEVSVARSKIEQSPYGYAVVTAGCETVLGLLQSSALRSASRGTIEAGLEAGPSTVRPHLSADKALERLRRRELTSAVVTNPQGRLLGVVRRSDLEGVVESG
jgi:CBS domain containing-hemolysin-like protein